MGFWTMLLGYWLGVATMMAALMMASRESK